MPGWASYCVLGFYYEYNTREKDMLVLCPASRFLPRDQGKWTALRSITRQETRKECHSWIWPRHPWIFDARLNNGADIWSEVRRLAPNEYRITLTPQRWGGHHAACIRAHHKSQLPGLIELWPFKVCAYLCHIHILFPYINTAKIIPLSIYYSPI